MTIGIEITGIEEYTANLKDLPARQQRAMIELLTKSALEIRNDAARSIQSGGKSGIVYRRRGRTHRSSAPGQAPATDTGTLVSRIDFKMSRGRELAAIVGTTLAYGIHLEFGTKNLDARPWLGPA